MKPHVKILKDNYAIGTGKHWCCTYAGFCARGETPSKAFNELDGHTKQLLSIRISNQQTRMFA